MRTLQPDVATLTSDPERVAVEQDVPVTRIEGIYILDKFDDAAKRDGRSCRCSFVGRSGTHDPRKYPCRCPR